jgi:hypothetical protein
MAVYCPSARQSILIILWRFMTIQTAVWRRVQVFAAVQYLETTFECNTSQSYTAYICLALGKGDFSLVNAKKTRGKEEVQIYC